MTTTPINASSHVTTVRTPSQSYPEAGFAVSRWHTSRDQGVELDALGTEWPFTYTLETSEAEELAVTLLAVAHANGAEFNGTVTTDGGEAFNVTVTVSPQLGIEGDRRV